MRLLSALVLCLGLTAFCGTLIDDDIAATVRRIETLSEREASWPRAFTLRKTADLLVLANPAKAQELRERAAALAPPTNQSGTHAPEQARRQLQEAIGSGDRAAIEHAAGDFLAAVEHGRENPDDYAWFADLRRRYDIVKGGDNPSVRAREALADLAELIRTDVDFELSEVSGSAVRLQPLPSSITVISFWATWCGPCVQELPMFDRMSRLFREPAVRFFALTDEPSGTVGAFVQAHPVSFPVLLDARRSVFRRFQIDTMPALVIFDGSGRLRFKASTITESELRNVLERLAPQ